MKTYREVNGRLSEEDQEDCLRRAVHDLELEGMKPTDDEVSLMRDVLAGRMTMDDAVRELLAKQGIDYEP